MGAYEYVSDIRQDGLIRDPDKAPPQDPVTPIERKADDYEHTWIGAFSVKCPGAGKSFYFEVKTKKILPARTLLGVYYGQDTTTTKQQYKAFIRENKDADNVLASSEHRYAVRGALACGPARANDGIEHFNCFLVYNADKRRMEMRTRSPLGPGIYEALVNYDTPNEKPRFWNDKRIDELPLDTQNKLRWYYSKPPTIFGKTTKKTVQRKKNKQNKQHESQVE
jgi:hypothetical protein